MNLRKINFLNKTETKSPHLKISSREESSFEVVQVDLQRLPEWTHLLLKDGTGIERYGSDHSRALYAVVHSMIRENFSDNEIASALTNRAYYLAETSFKHAQTSSRGKAANWVINQNVKKARISTPLKNKDGQSKSKLEFIEFGDINYESESMGLIDGTVDHKSFVLIYGESNSGKTFAALEIAMCLSRGEPWQKRDVSKTKVLYILTEGKRGFARRISAWKKKYKIKEADFVLGYGSCDLLSNQVDTNFIINQVKTMNENGSGIGAIFIDTFNRVFSGGDENASGDMGKFVKNIDLLIKETSATIFLIHHTGKDTSRGARGHSSLKAAVDTEIFVDTKKKGIRTLKFTKQRDYKAGNTLAFKLEKVVVGTDRNGNLVDSCVTIPIDYKDVPNESPISEITQSILNFMHENGTVKALPSVWPGRSKFVNKADLKKYLAETRYAGSNRRNSAVDALRKALIDLECRNLIEMKDDFVRLKPT
jgi:hypothetical protein